MTPISKTAISSRPRLVVCSRDDAGLVEHLENSLREQYASIVPVSSPDKLIAGDNPWDVTVILADFRGTPDHPFNETDVAAIGRIQARAPAAHLALLTPPLNAWLRRRLWRTGAPHIYSEPIDWNVVCGHLRELARRLSPGEGRAPHREIGILEICQAMGSTLELHPLLDKILALMTEYLMAHQGSILLFDRETDQLRMLAARGLPERITNKGYIPRKGSIAEWVIDNGKPLVMHEELSDKPISSIGDRKEIASSICMPLRARGESMGVININRLAPAEHFSDDDLRVAQILAAQAAISIENARLFEANLQAERLATIGETIAQVSHGMKSIVTCLRGGVSMCEQARDKRSWKKFDECWDLVRRGTHRLSAMALEMLEYSKQRRDPVRVRFDLDSVLAEVLEDAQPRIGEKQVRLSFLIEGGANTVAADPEQIFRAILNLVDNAIDAIQREGEVTIRVHRVAGEALGDLLDGTLAGSLGAASAGGEQDENSTTADRGAILIEIADTGPGIPLEHQKKIFEPFFSSKGSQGTGLGLASTNKIIEEHNGRILLDSAPGQGARFTIVLPDAPE